MARRGRPGLSAGKPAVFRAFELAARLLTTAGLERIFRAWMRLCFMEPGFREAVRANIRRIHAWRRSQGAPPEDGDADAAVDRLALNYARERLDLYTIDARRDELVAGVRLDLKPALEALLAEGRGAVLATPHFGGLVPAMTALAASGVRLTAMFLAGWPYRWAEARTGMRILDLGEGALPCLRALAAGEAVLLYADMDYFPDGRAVPFFGAPFRPPHGPARLAMAAGAPILPVYAVWRGGGCSFECDEPIRTRPAAPQAAVEEAILRSMERFIGRYPEQWLILADAWDLEGNERRYRRQLQTMRLAREARGLLGRLTS